MRLGEGDFEYIQRAIEDLGEKTATVMENADEKIRELEDVKLDAEHANEKLNDFAETVKEIIRVVESAHDVLDDAYQLDLT